MYKYLENAVYELEISFLIYQALVTVASQLLQGLSFIGEDRVAFLVISYVSFNRKNIFLSV